MEVYYEWLELENRKAPVYFLCGYIPMAMGHDALSQQLLSFKAGEYDAKGFWLEPFLILCKRLFNKDESEFIIRALGHEEFDVNLNTDHKNPLGFLCRRAAPIVNARYVAGMLHKRGPTPQLKRLSREERWQIIKDNFDHSQIFSEGNTKTFWFVDDIITTGATARATWKALLELYPDAEFKVIALARTVREQDYNMNSHIFIGNGKQMLAREDEEIYGSDNFSSPKVLFTNEDTFFI